MNSDSSQCSFIKLFNAISVEMDSSIASFRQVLRQAWSRRVVLVLTTAIPPPSPDRLTVDYIMSLRDPEWEEKERSYHETALEEVNSLVRKHNAMAPYIARRALYMRSVELERMYKESAKEIHQKLVAKLNGNDGEMTLDSARNDEGDDFTNTRGTSPPSLGIWAMIKELFTRVSSSSAFQRPAKKPSTATPGRAIAGGLMAPCVIAMAGLIKIGWEKSELQARSLQTPSSSGADMMGQGGNDASVRG